VKRKADSNHVIRFSFASNMICRVGTRENKIKKGFQTGRMKTFNNQL